MVPSRLSLCMSSYLTRLRIYRQREARPCGSWRRSSRPSWARSWWRQSTNTEAYSRASTGSVPWTLDQSTRCSRRTKDRTNQRLKNSTSSTETSSSLSITSSWTTWLRSKEAVIPLISTLLYKLAWSSFSDLIETYRALANQLVGIHQDSHSCRPSKEMSARRFWTTTWSILRARSSRACVRWTLRR